MDKKAQEQANESYKIAIKDIKKQIKNEEVDALAVSVIKHYEILLSWGGPATRIYGTLDENNEPETAKFQFQDWGIDWTTAEYQDEDLLLDYAKNYYFDQLS